MPNQTVEQITVNNTTYDIVDAASGYSKAYKIIVTATTSGNTTTYSSDKTYSEINTAITSGDYDYIYLVEGEYTAGLSWDYDGTIDAITFVCIYNEISETYGPVDSGNKNIIRKYQIKTDDSVTVFDSTIPPYMTILNYGRSTWKDFIDAYNNNSIVYCRAGSGTTTSAAAKDPQTRMAFMAYVNAFPPTNVEFQYYRSRNGHNDTYQGDQVYVYKLSNTGTGTWTLEVRNVYTKMIAGAGLVGTIANASVDGIANQATLTFKTKLKSETKLTNAAAAATETSGRVYPVALDTDGYLACNVPWTDSLPAVTASDNGKILQVIDGQWALVSATDALGNVAD